VPLVKAHETRLWTAVAIQTWSESRNTRSSTVYLKNVYLSENSEYLKNRLPGKVVDARVSNTFVQPPMVDPILRARSIEHHDLENNLEKK
jgi:hypothetical protein